MLTTGPPGHTTLLAVQGDTGALRAKYEARWHTFLHSTQPTITHADVPWPAGPDAAPDVVERVLLHGAAQGQERRKRLRLELVSSKALPSGPCIVVLLVKRNSRLGGLQGCCQAMI